MLLTALFIIAEMGKQSTCQSTNVQVNYIFENGILFINKKEINTDTCHNMDETYVKNIMLNERKRLKKKIYCTIPFI